MGYCTAASATRDMKEERNPPRSPNNDFKAASQRQPHSHVLFLKVCCAGVQSQHTTSWISALFLSTPASLPLLMPFLVSFLSCSALTQPSSPTFSLQSLSCSYCRGGSHLLEGTEHNAVSDLHMKVLALLQYYCLCIAMCYTSCVLLSPKELIFYSCKSKQRILGCFTSLQIQQCSTLGGIIMA